MEAKGGGQRWTSPNLSLINNLQHVYINDNIRNFFNFYWFSRFSPFNRIVWCLRKNTCKTFLMIASDCFNAWNNIDNCIIWKVSFPSVFFPFVVPAAFLFEFVNWFQTFKLLIFDVFRLECIGCNVETL